MKPYRFLSLAALIAGASFISSCNGDDPKPVVVPPSEAGLIEVDGGGATYPNTVFVDLSTGTQTAVKRESWDLAFATGSEFKVLINGTTGAMALATELNDISMVTEANLSEEDAAKLVLSFTNLEGILHVDDPSMPLSKPVISAISATELNNKVYILNRGSSAAEERPWKKIRVIRKGEGYTLQHADLDATEFASVDIAKDNDRNFVYFSFENGIVEVEPGKSSWDIAWTAGTSSTPYPQATNGILAYFFQDLVIHNIYGGTAAAQVLVEEVAYENFTAQDAEGLTFSSTDRLTIGSSWRVTQPSQEIKQDRYYVLKDTESNTYKIRFLSLTKDGERGSPSFEYELVKAE